MNTVKKKLLRKNLNYQTKLNEFKNNIKISENKLLYKYQLEYAFESLKDWSVFSSLDEVSKWFISKRKNVKMKVKNISLEDLTEWEFDKKGNLSHISGEFFRIHGLRTFTKLRETNEKYWDQPIITQVGYDGGILGIIRKRFNKIPHYLCEAKAEPGNYGIVQISPTIQATFSNINQAHKGRKPNFIYLFKSINKQKNIEILFDSWLAEDGGRMNKKRNRSLLIQVPETMTIDIPNNNYLWLTLYQLKALLKKNAWVNPHVRGIIAHT